MTVDYKNMTLEECYEYEEHFFDIECDGDKKQIKIKKMGVDELLTKCGLQED